MSDYDVVVVGLGAMGAHAAMTLAGRGANVLGIERFGPAHDRGSHHGDSRIIRMAYFEDPCYVPLVRRAYAAWREIETASGQDLLTILGILQIGRPEGALVRGVMASCEMYGLAHEVLNRAEMATRFPAFGLDAGEVAVLDPQGGALDPERAVLTALRLAGAAGARLRFGEAVSAIEPEAGGVLVRVGDAKLRARKVIVAAGSYVAGLVPALAGIVRPIRAVSGYFPPLNGRDTAPGRMPIFLREEGDGSFYGFPTIGRDGVKVGRHGHFQEPLDPEAANAPVNDRDRDYIGDFIRRRLPAVSPAGHKFTTCRYTNLPGEDFLIDRLPGCPDIVVASPCSGHGFKFAPVVGEILADMALDGGTDLPVAPFTFARLEARNRGSIL